MKVNPIFSPIFPHGNSYPIPINVYLILPHGGHDPVPTGLSAILPSLYKKTKSDILP